MLMIRVQLSALHRDKLAVLILSKYEVIALGARGPMVYNQKPGGSKIHLIKVRINYHCRCQDNHMAMFSAKIYIF